VGLRRPSPRATALSRPATCARHRVRALRVTRPASGGFTEVFARCPRVSRTKYVDGTLHRFFDGMGMGTGRGGNTRPSWDAPILGRARAGDERSRSELLALVYDELRRVASGLMQRERLLRSGSSRREQSCRHWGRARSPINCSTKGASRQTMVLPVLTCCQPLESRGPSPQPRSRAGDSDR
jgi:hypothetical protein